CVHFFYNPSSPTRIHSLSLHDALPILKAFDRAIFGGSPAQVPQAYRHSSPLTYVDQVQAPVLILAGRNDPRCPLRQIQNYVTALDRKSTRLNSSHVSISYAVFCLKKKR